MSDFQQTIAREVSVAGVGIHTGEPCTLLIRPAPADSGIVFRRADLPAAAAVVAEVGQVVRTELGTTIGAGEVVVHTVEHLMAAFAATGIDNAVVEVDGAEIPILDGSFSPWIRLLREAGTETGEAPARIIEVCEPITVTHPGGGRHTALPCDGLRISATIDFDHPAIGRQFGDFRIDSEGFASEIADARTFGFRSDVEALRARGFARGASLENTVVLEGDRVLNDSLRHTDEFLRHKVGDLVGDLWLTGGRVRAHIVSERPSHAANVALVRAILEQRRRHRSRQIDIRRIMHYLPHRYPLLLVDRILEFESRRRIVGLKNVTINEPFFGGHFPEHPVMPGVLVIEAMAQVGGLLLMDTVSNPRDKVVYFMSLNNVKWRRPVVPGDQLILELELTRFRRATCRMKGRGMVDGQVVAEAEMTARIVDR